MANSKSFRQSLSEYKSKKFVGVILSRDKTPMSILLLSAVVGLIAGLIGTFFEMGVHWVTNTRTDWLKQELNSLLPLWLAAIIVSATLAFVGYYLVNRFAPEAAWILVFPKLKGQWMIFVLFAGGE